MLIAEIQIDGKTTKAYDITKDKKWVGKEIPPTLVAEEPIEESPGVFIYPKHGIKIIKEQ